MASQALPERVASPSFPRRACPPRRLARSPPRPWLKLPAETQKQVAQAIAGTKWFLRKSDPDPSYLGGQFENVTSLLKS